LSLRAPWRKVARTPIAPINASSARPLCTFLPADCLRGRSALIDAVDVLADAFEHVSRPVDDCSMRQRRLPAWCQLARFGARATIGDGAEVVVRMVR